MPIPLAFTKLLRSFESCAEAVEKLVIFRKGVPKLFHTWMIFLKKFFENVNLKKNLQWTKKVCKINSKQREAFTVQIVKQLDICRL